MQWSFPQPKKIKNVVPNILYEFRAKRLFKVLMFNS